MTLYHHAAQTEQDRERFLQLGVQRQRILVTGNLKFDAALPEDFGARVAAAREKLQRILQESQALATVYQYQQRLSQLWERTAASQEVRLESLQEWIRQAEATGVDALAHFAQQLRGYTVQTR